MKALEPCPGCGARLPASDGPTHRYLGASAACWAIYTAMLAGEPPIASTPALEHLVDAYAAQHPGTPSNQATRSVAVHLIALYAVFVKGTDTGRLVWVRQRALRAKPGEKHGRFHWLTPPDFTRSLTVADIAHAPNPQARAELVERYVRGVWEAWSREHAATVARWHGMFVVKD
jgi:hypothetical protein